LGSSVDGEDKTLNKLSEYKHPSRTINLRLAEIYFVVDRIINYL
jgi:hypothetical protein